VLVRDGARVSLSGTVGSLAEKRLATELAHVAGVRSVDADHLDVEPWARDAERRLGAVLGVADRDIRSAVERALMLDPRVASRAIEVEVRNAETVLRGEVVNMSASRAADRNARNTAGVREVTNLLTVEPVTQSDEQIAMRVETALMNSGIVGNTPLMIKVSNGNARLVGDVADAEQYFRADELVANTRGVQSLSIDLTIQGEGPRFSMHRFSVTPNLMIPVATDNGEPLTDRSLFEAVESELFWSPFVDEDDVRIEVDDGVVTLSGEVDSNGEYQAAAENALEAGAVVVHNELEIQ
jgi:osmotically-inducible protein OsmY